MVSLRGQPTAVPRVPGRAIWRRCRFALRLAVGASAAAGAIRAAAASAVPAEDGGRAALALLIPF